VAVIIPFFSAVCLLAVDTTTGAQTLTLLANFGNSGPNDLILSGSTLYGTLASGGDNGYGAVFQINTNGSSFEILHLFGGGNDDGGDPGGSLVLSGSTLYGTTVNGGNSYGDGTVFEIDTNGTNYAILFSLVPWIGENPHGSLTLSGPTLYGTTTSGGSYNSGAVIQINTNGTDCADLYDFGGYPDGASPNGSLVLSGSTLYGTTTYGGSNDYGTVFAINTDGSGYSILHSFSTAPGDGYNPNSSLILSGSTLYGTTVGGGRSNGTVFKINTNGTGFAVLYGFGLIPADGYNPYGQLTLSGSTLYGTTLNGGSNNYGTVFQINTDGTGYQVFYNFNGTLGSYPKGALTLSGSTLFGIAGGLLFALQAPPPIIPPTLPAFYVTSIAQQSNDILITWTSGVGTTNSLQATAGDASGGYNANGFAEIFAVTNTVGTVTNYLDAGAVTNFTARYYRVRLVP
jgi:uncharacterized repeat protein (TIGR03803 family)